MDFQQYSYVWSIIKTYKTCEYRQMCVIRKRTRSAIHLEMLEIKFGYKWIFTHITNISLVVNWSSFISPGDCITNTETQSHNTMCTYMNRIMTRDEKL